MLSWHVEQPQGSSRLFDRTVIYTPIIAEQQNHQEEQQAGVRKAEERMTKSSYDAHFCVCFCSFNSKVVQLKRLGGERQLLLLSECKHLILATERVLWASCKVVVRNQAAEPEWNLNNVQQDSFFVCSGLLDTHGWTFCAVSLNTSERINTLRLINRACVFALISKNKGWLTLEDRCSFCGCPLLKHSGNSRHVTSC